MPGWTDILCLAASLTSFSEAGALTIAGENVSEEVQIRADEAGGSFAIVVRPRVSGTYRIEVRYGSEITEWLGPTLGFFQIKGAIHEHFGARFRLEVVDIRSGAAIEPAKGGGWARVFSSSSAGIRYAADIKTYPFRRGRAYRATLVVEESSAELQPGFALRLASTPTASTKNNSIFNPFRFIPPLGGKRLGP